MRILLAVDLREESDALIDHAVAWTRRMGATLHIRTVSTLLGEGGAGAFDTAMVQDWGELKCWEAERVRRLASRIDPEIRGTVGVLDGLASEKLVDLSGAYDLLVMGTHGRKGLSRLLQGSVAARVIRAANAPVLVIPGSWSGRIPEHHLGVLCPMDVDETDTRAATWCRDKLRDAHFDLAYAVRLAPRVARRFGGALGPSGHPKASRAQAVLDDLAASNELPMSRSHLTLCTEANPGSRLSRLAGALGSNLIALPTHGRRGISRLLQGSVTERVIRDAPCPVLVVR